jgi:N-acetylglucosaminyldiphosphoundecaprenol N-acetyl-beta-D-mannosaminyltransferase
LISKIRFGDFWVNDFTIDRLNSLIKDTVSENKKLTIAHHNIHSLFLSFKTQELKKFYDNCDYIHIDGMPLVLICKLFGRSINRHNRITYMDWIIPLLHICDRNEWRIFYLGSKPDVAAIAIKTLKVQFHSIEFEYHSGYFDMLGEENQEIVKEINSFSPEILFVGMGMPRQELWIQQNFTNLDTKVLLPCGACFDYIAGAIKTPPRWTGRVGLEWLYRLIHEPKRLFRRYLVEPFIVFFYLLKG